MYCKYCNAEIAQDSFLCIECGKVDESLHDAVIQSYLEEIIDKATTGYESKNYDTAIKFFNKAIEIDPDDAEVRQWLIDIRSEYSAISEILKKAHEHYEDKKYEDAMDAARQALEMAPGLNAAVEIEEKVERRFTELQEAISTGKAYLETNRFEQAIEKFKVAGDMDPYSSEVAQFRQKAQSLLEAWHQEKERLEKFREDHAFREAIAFAQKMLERRSFDEEIQTFIAETKNTVKTLENNRETGERALAEEKYKEAVKAWDNVVKILPDDSRARQKLEKARAELIKERAAKRKFYTLAGIGAAVALVVILVVLTALLNRRHVNWGREYIKLEQPEKALAELDRAGSFFVSQEEVQLLRKQANYLLHLNMGNQARETGEWENALSEYEKAADYASSDEKLQNYIKLVEVSKTLQKARGFAEEENFEKAIETTESVEDSGAAENVLPEMETLLSEAAIMANHYRQSWLDKAIEMLDEKKFLLASKEVRKIISKCRDDEETQALFWKCRDEWLSSTRRMREEEKWEDALLEYQRMSVSYPENKVIQKEIRGTKAERLIKRAAAALKDERYELAIDYCNESIELTIEQPEIASGAREILKKAKAAVEEKYTSAMKKVGEALSVDKLEDARNELLKALSYKNSEEAVELLNYVNGRLNTPEGMLFIEKGCCIIGDSTQTFWKREGPSHKVELGPYYIDKYPVTNAQYMEFVKATKHRLPAHWVENDGKIPEGKSRHPVTHVSLEDAAAYASWAGKRLPSEEEWEKAARGTEGLKYPWGSEYVEGMANDENSGLNTTCEVGSYQKGKSPFGCFDMAGNVWEWTSSKFEPYPDSDYEAEPEEEKMQVLKGGCYTDDKLFIRSSFRELVEPEGPYSVRATIGFRCAADVKR